MLDDFSRFIVAWKLCATMRADDVTATLEERPLALTVPDEAVFGEGDQSFVYLVKPDSSVTRVRSMTTSWP